MPLIELKNISKVYKAGKLELPVLVDINLIIANGEMVAVGGPSGSGKTTLMNIIGLLDRPTKGELKIAGEHIDLSMSDRKLARMRSEKIGFIFQSFNLLPRMSARENVLLASKYCKTKKFNWKQRATEVLEQVGLQERQKHRPSELSGGEQQRVAIARALMNDPQIILADEPTGNLDSQSGQEIIKILLELNKKGKTVIVVTHNEKISQHCSRIVHLLDGKII